MSDEKKTPFWFGFFAGASAVSLLVFIGLFTVILSGGASLSKDSGTTTKTVNTVVQQPGGTAGEPEVVGGPVVPIKDTEYVKGNPDAPIEIIEYSDFECPYCLAFSQSLEQVFAEYGDQVKLVYRHFPLSFHPNAQKAAEASECAGEQGKFWEMHDQIFASAEVGNMGVARWKELAQNLGLNTSQFNDCLDTGKYAGKVAADMSEGQAAGVTGTPGSFINGQPLKGALPYAQIKAIIDAELQK